MGRRILYCIILTLAMFGLWLLLSGIYTPLLLMLGVFSSVLTVFIVHHMGLVDRETLFLTLRWRALTYPGWLMKEIIKANWMMARVILAPRLKLQQQFLHVPASQKSETGRVLFANSITLTPGTITVETEKNHFLVHAVVETCADRQALAAMDSHVCAVEATR